MLQLKTGMSFLLITVSSLCLIPANEAGAADSSEILSWDMAIVHIDRQCQADPQRVTIDTEHDRWSPDKRYQVMWIAEKSDGDLVTITPKSPQEQDPTNPQRGLMITRVFETGYWIPGSKNAVTSGLPNLPADAGSVIWRYDIEIRDAKGNIICKVDPDICIRGTGGCGN